MKKRSKKIGGLFSKDTELDWLIGQYASPAFSTAYFTGLDQGMSQLQAEKHAMLTHRGD